MAGYRRHWGPHRLERLGDIFMVPPGESLFIRGGSIRQASLVCRLLPEAIHAAFPLLMARGIPGEVVMQHGIEHALQVDAFG